MTTTTTRPSELMRANLDADIGIPRELYLDEGLFAREVDDIFNGSWRYACHVSQLADVGAYTTVECGAESVVVTRAEHGELAAFQNVCRHRGARVVDAGCGTAARIVCPYHQWTYRLDGSLRGAPRMPAGFARERHGLLPVAVESWQGFVFVHLDAAPPPLAETLGAGDALITPFDLPAARVAHTITYEVAANWKLVWENAQECYHCSANHPEFTRSYDLAASLTTDAIVDVHLSPDGRTQAGRFPMREGTTSLTVSGQPASGRLLGSADYTASVHHKPTFAAVCSPDYAVVLADSPLGIDRTEVRMSWLVAADAIEDRDYDLDDLIKVWDCTNRQDWALCERTQLGVRSRAYVPGPLATDEASVATFYRVYADLLAAADL